MTSTNFTLSTAMRHAVDAIVQLFDSVDRTTTPPDVVRAIEEAHAVTMHAYGTWLHAGRPL